MKTTIYDWLSTMGKMIVQPTPKTIREEAKKAKGKSTSAYFLLVILFILFTLFRFYLNLFDPQRDLYGTIVIGLILPVVFFFYVFCVNLLYKRLFKRNKDYMEALLYLMAAIFFVMFILNILVSFIPYGNYISWAVFVYMFYLNVLSLKTLTNLKVWQAVITIMLAALLGIPGILCIPAFIFNVNDMVPTFFGG